MSPHPGASPLPLSPLSQREGERLVKQVLVIIGVLAISASFIALLSIRKLTREPAR